MAMIVTVVAFDVMNYIISPLSVYIYIPYVKWSSPSLKCICMRIEYSAGILNFSTSVSMPTPFSNDLW